MVLDQTGSLANVKRHDYLPFGEELQAGIGHRTTGDGYSGSDGVRQQFTAKERDSETGLDYFLARYYSSVQGRFTSPDEFTGGPVELYYFAGDASTNPTFYADLTLPQSLNKYQYAFNNPGRFHDPNGHCPTCEMAEELSQTPVGQWAANNADKLITAAGVGLTSAIVAASGALDKLKTWAEKNPPQYVCVDNVCGDNPNYLFAQNSGVKKDVVIDASKHPDAATTAGEAQNSGQPNVVTVDRGPQVKDRRRAAQKGHERVPGKDLDEYPGAVFKEGGEGAYVRPTKASDNRGAGASIGQQIKDVQNGEKVRIVITNWWKDILK
jgi:RHS repeat-associated protein